MATHHPISTAAKRLAQAIRTHHEAPDEHTAAGMVAKYAETKRELGFTETEVLHEANEWISTHRIAAAAGYSSHTPIRRKLHRAETYGGLERGMTVVLGGEAVEIATAPHYDHTTEVVTVEVRGRDGTTRVETGHASDPINPHEEKTMTKSDAIAEHKAARADLERISKRDRAETDAYLAANQRVIEAEKNVSRWRR